MSTIPNSCWIKHFKNQLTCRRAKEMEEWYILNSFVHKTHSAFNLMFLFLFNNLYSNILSFIPLNCTTLNKYSYQNYFTIKYENIIQIKLTLHLKISGPSKLNGLVLSGTHFISYSLVKTVLVNHSLGEKWNSKAKP